MLLCTAHGLFVTIMVSIVDARQLMYIGPSPLSNSGIAHSLLNGNNEYLKSCVRPCTSANGIHSPNVPTSLPSDEWYVGTCDLAISIVVTTFEDKVHKLWYACTWGPTTATTSEDQLHKCRLQGPFS